jgi:Uma2 family endonuclease
VSVMSGAEWERAQDVGELELVDGIVRPRALPTPAHQHIKSKLRDLLSRLALSSMTVVTDVEVRLDDQLRRRPDVLVVRIVGLDSERGRVDPEHVVLAVEVVCRGSEITDRKHKPVEYADADLPHYWRVETAAGPRLHTYRLGENSFYLETGLFREGDLVVDPTLRWASFEVDELAEPANR